MSRYTATACRRVGSLPATLGAVAEGVRVPPLTMKSPVSTLGGTCNSPTVRRWRVVPTMPTAAWASVRHRVFKDFLNSRPRKVNRTRNTPFF